MILWNSEVICRGPRQTMIAEEKGNIIVSHNASL